MISSYASQVLTTNSIADNYLFFLPISGDEAWVGQKGGEGGAVTNRLFTIFLCDINCKTET
jgi:hypothetical protein